MTNVVTTVVVDTCALSNLILAKATESLKVIWTTVYTTPKVVEELAKGVKPALEPVREFASSLPDWIIVKAPTSVDPSLPKGLRPADAEVISLAREMKLDWVVTDDGLVRRTVETSRSASAAEFGGHRTEVTGTLGVLQEGHHRGMLSFHKSVDGLVMNDHLGVDTKVLDASQKMLETRTRRLSPEEMAAAKAESVRSEQATVVREGAQPDSEDRQGRREKPDSRRAEHERAEEEIRTPRLKILAVDRAAEDVTAYLAVHYEAKTLEDLGLNKSSSAAEILRQARAEKFDVVVTSQPKLASQLRMEAMGEKAGMRLVTLGEKLTPEQNTMRLRAELAWLEKRKSVEMTNAQREAKRLAKLGGPGFSL